MSNICPVCDNDKFENLDGYYYCTICSTKSQSQQDIQLAEDELVQGGAKIQITTKQTKQSKKDKALEEDSGTSYSTIHIYNYVLKAQVDDLVNLGCDPSIKKLGLAFTNDGKIDEKNIKWQRDKKYFETYKMKFESNVENEVSKEEIEEKMEDDDNKAMNDDSQINETLNDTNYEYMLNEELNEDLSFEKTSEHADDDVIENFEEKFEHEDIDEANIDEMNDIKGFKTTRKRILLTKFEYVRMPHTIAILNLGLLIIKSPILLTDLIRFINQGKVSYSNINSILPKSVKFIYLDDGNMFNVKAIPHADHLRILTIKLGKYLEMDDINIIDMNQITTRYVIDLNLPYEMVALVNGLMVKYPDLVITKINFDKTNNINLEANALVYILVVIIITFLYNQNDYSSQDEENYKMKFSFLNWFNQMQKILTRIKGDIVGFDINEIKGMEDIKSLNYSCIDYRHHNETKAYLTRYHDPMVIEALGLPLKTEATDEVKEKSLFFITKQRKELVSMNKHSIEHLFDDTKIKLITKNRFKDRLFTDFCKSKILDKELIGKYLIGFETNTLFWLIDCFQQISQTHSYHAMFRYLLKVINKFL